jgi:ribose 1,5-bisphosphokinase
MGSPRPKRARPSPGRLVLVVGPSGAGKDTLISAAKRKFRDDPTIVFPRRVITRPESIGEDHVPMSRRDFALHELDGAFFLSWQAHGLRYGVPCETLKDLEAGRIVVVNVSRDIVTEACARWPHTHIVQVTVALDALKARLEARGRETAEDIKRRLARAKRKKQLPNLAIDMIDNSGHLPTAVRKFNALIAGYAAALTAAKGKR